jgi:hypothetical protein
MVTTTYKRFCDLPPLPPLFFVDTPKKLHPKTRKVCPPDAVFEPLQGRNQHHLDRWRVTG